MIYRLEVLKNWLAGKRNGVPFTELLEQLTERTNKAKALSIIQNTRERNRFVEVYLEGIGSPLHYPAELPLSSLYQTITEEFYPSNWHYYKVKETQVEPRDVVIDCGAAEGLFSLLVAPYCKKVYAIEPLPRFVQALKLTFERIDNVEILPIALANGTGEAMLSQSDISSELVESSKDAVPVSVDTIDNLFYRNGIPVDYIKADVEGSELRMLEGAVNTIRENRPKIAVTTYHRAGDADEIKALLLNLDVGYRVMVKGIAGGGMPIMLHAWTER